MPELPPAIAKYVADAEPFVRGTNKAVQEAQKFGRSADKAALAARKMGVEARQAAEKAAAAGKVAAEAAQRAEKGLIKQAEAARLAARAETELERAELKQAAAAIIAAEASDKARKAQEKGALAARSMAKEGEKAGSLLARAFEGGVSAADSALSSLGSTGPVAIGAVVVALAAVPIAGTAAGAGITLGLGGALVGIGLMATKGTAEAKAAIASLKSDTQTQAQRMFAPFKSLWTEIPKIARSSLRMLSPAVREASAELTPELKRFGHEGAASMSELQPAILGAERAFAAILRTVGPQLPSIMRSLAGAVTAVTSAVSDNPRVIASMVQGFADLVRYGGEAIGVLVRVTGWLQQHQQAAQNVLRGMAWINPALGGLVQLGATMQSTGGAASQMGASVQGAMDAARRAQERWAASSGGAQSAQQALTSAMRSEATTADQLKAALDRLTGANQNAEQANLAYRNAIASATRGIKENGHSLDLNTQKGRNNRQALLDVARAAQAHIEAMRASGASMSTVSAASAAARSRFIALATSMGASKAQASALAAAILGIKSKSVTVTTHFKTTGMVNNPGTSREFHASGGRITGPGSGTSDSIPAWLSNGEYVVNARSASRYLPELDAMNAGAFAAGGRVGFASGGKVSVGGVSVSTSQWRSLGQQLGKDFLKTMSDGSASQIASLDSRLEKAISKLFAGKRTQLDNKLIAYLDKNSSKLEKLAGQRDAATKALADAKQYSSTTTGNALSFAGLSTIQNPMAASQVRNSLNDRLRTIRMWAADIKKLKARGLSKSLLKQVVDAGPEQGLALAEALIGADPGTMAAINSTQASIESASTSIGRWSADAMYDAGRHAGDGFLTGLQASMKSLDKEMDALAKKLAKSIKKALKIKSPSHLPELRYAGAMTVAGVAAGMDSGLGRIDGASQRLAVRLARPRNLYAGGVGRGQTATPQIIEQHFHIAGHVLTERQLYGIVQKEALKHGRRNPSNGLAAGV